MTSPDSPGALAAFSDGLADAVARVARSVVAIHARPRIPSSGVLWRDGVIVAANHTVKRDEEITVALDGGATARASVAGRDPGTDLAVLRLDGALPPGAGAADVGDGGALRVGHFVLAVGRPADDGVTASMGLVSALGPAWRTWAGGQIDQFVRLDLSIYDGFSGGPLVDGRGRVVGINSSGLARGMALAVPASTVRRVVEQLLERGHVVRGYIGLGMQPVRLPAALRERVPDAGETGVMVVSVEPGGPADRAGVLLGDILVALDGAPVADTEDVQAQLGPDRVGRPLAARLIRGGAPQEATITVGERPKREGR
ncbi:MAG TPA: S1C family serine protease [Gemmatimonadaceae bacterium]|nr:S1C family serine protease [Gemmatimonadaceae bacterium]